MMVIVLVPSFSLFHSWLYLFLALMRQACLEVDEICLQEWKIQFLVLLFVSMQVFSRSAHGISLPYPKWPRSTTTMVLWHIKHPRRTSTVNQTASIGLTPVSRDRAHTRHLKPSGSSLFDFLFIFPFTSESKHMRIIVHDTSTHEILFLQKGADVLIAQRRDAREGLRTHVIIRKSFSPKVGEEVSWCEFLKGRNDVMQNVIREILEYDSELLGWRIFELLKNAGVKIWILKKEIKSKVSDVLPCRPSW